MKGIVNVKKVLIVTLGWKVVLGSLTKDGRI